jgi:microcystin-dependent protein
MADQFLGEIRAFGFNFPPLGWAFCNGQILAITQNTALFSLLGTNFGGNGTSNFGLPDLQGRMPVFGNGSPSAFGVTVLGESGGSPTVTLLTTEMPAHTHGLQVSTKPATGRTPTGSLPAVASGVASYGDPGGATTQLDAQALTLAGGSGAHNNMQPYLGLNFCIALEGIFPERG